MKLIEKMPGFYQESLEVRELQNAFGTQLEKTMDAWDDILAQCFVTTATWSIPLWERTVGIEPEEGKDITYRRTRILSKLRGGGTSTKAMLKNVIESFYNGQVDIIEYPAEFRFEVKFLSTIGIPPNLDDVTKTIEEMKPAHLDYSYRITFVLHGELKRFTHEQLAKKTHEQIRNEAVINDGNRLFTLKKTWAGGLL